MVAVNDTVGHHCCHPPRHCCHVTVALAMGNVSPLSSSATCWSGGVIICTLLGWMLSSPSPCWGEDIIIIFSAGVEMMSGVESSSLLSSQYWGGDVIIIFTVLGWKHHHCCCLRSTGVELLLLLSLQCWGGNIIVVVFSGGGGCIHAMHDVVVVNMGEWRWGVCHHC